MALAFGVTLLSTATEKKEEAEAATHQKDIKTRKQEAFFEIMDEKRAPETALNSLGEHTPNESTTMKQTNRFRMWNVSEFPSSIHFYPFLRSELN